MTGIVPSFRGVERTLESVVCYQDPVGSFTSSWLVGGLPFQLSCLSWPVSPAVCPLHWPWDYTRRNEDAGPVRRLAERRVVSRIVVRRGYRDSVRSPLSMTRRKSFRRVEQGFGTQGRNFKLFVGVSSYFATSGTRPARLECP